MQRCYLFFCAILLLAAQSNGQNEYEPSKEFPFGRYNPAAPKALLDYELLIGECSCTSTSRAPDGSWQEAVAMTWRFKYIMNGWAIQDETLKADGKHSGSIRQYSPKEEHWLIHYYSSASPAASLPTWVGGKSGDKLVYRRPQKAPNGADGFYRLTFSDLSSTGFKWIGEWVSTDESIVYPTWKIDCQRE
ncbi:MAG: hypothetical protein AAGF89_02175 [Bacteroidota bacterium]